MYLEFTFERKFVFNSVQGRCTVLLNYSTSTGRTRHCPGSHCTFHAWSNCISNTNTYMYRLHLTFLKLKVTFNNKTTYKQHTQMYCNLYCSPTGFCSLLLAMR